MKYRVVQVQHNGDLSRIHTQAGAPGSQPRPGPLCAHSAPPAKKEKVDDGGKGKNQICKSTKYINLFGQGECGENSAGGVSHLASLPDHYSCNAKGRNSNPVFTYNDSPPLSQISEAPI